MMTDGCWEESASSVEVASLKLTWMMDELLKTNRVKTRLDDA